MKNEWMNFMQFFFFCSSYYGLPSFHLLIPKKAPCNIFNKVFYKQLPLKTSTMFIHYILLGCPSLNYAITSNHHMVDYYFSMKFLFLFWENFGKFLDETFFSIGNFLTNFAKFSGKFQQISDIVKSKNWNILCCLYEVLIQGWAVLSFSKKELWGKGWVYGSLNRCSQKKSSSGSHLL